MVLVPQEKIEAYTARGWWGTQTFDELFRAHVSAQGERMAVVDAPNRAAFTDGTPQALSYAQLEEAVGRLCTVLLQDGLRRDDIVVVQLPNSVEQFIVYLACARLGIVVSPVPIQYREHELHHVLGITSAKAAITARRIGRQAHARMFAALQAHHPTLRSVYAWGTPGPVDDAAGPLPPGVAALDARLQETSDAGALARHVDAHPVTANDVFSICWTSGTEAQPKGVCRSHNEWLVLAPSAIEGAGLKPHCRMLTPFPLVNMAGLSVGLAGWLLLGGTVVQHHPFDLQVFLQQLRAGDIDYTIAAPAILGRLLQDETLTEGIDFSRIPAIGSGSAPLSEWLVQGFHERFGVQIVNHFGSNEGASLTGSPKDIPSPRERARYFPRAGVPGHTWAISTTRKFSTRLVDPDTGEDITEPGRPGELRFAGATIFSGYYNAPELTQRAFDEQGYYRSGDLFEIGGERQQYYRYVGRSKDIVVRGGMNISSEEVENLVLAHPKVRECAAIGCPDALMGERVCVCVVPREGSAPTLDELNAFLRDTQHVAAYKLPERLELLDALPRNPVGKVLKRVLRERFSHTTDA